MSQLLKSELPGHSESKSHLLYVDFDKQVYTHVGHKTSSVSLMKSFSVFQVLFKWKISDLENCHANLLVLCTRILLNLD